MMGGVKLRGFKSVIIIKKLSNKPPTKNLNSTVILKVQPIWSEWIKKASKNK